MNNDHRLKHCDFNRTQDKEALGLNVYMRLVSDERSLLTSLYVSEGRRL